jgi:hypothetical protein
VNYTTVVSVNNNQSLDVTDTFAAASNVRYLKLDVSKVKGAAEGVRIATLEAIGSKITSTGTVDVLTRTLSQTVVADDATETAADQKDWNQL